jgi:hypothetical protein
LAGWLGGWVMAEDTYLFEDGLRRRVNHEKRGEKSFERSRQYHNCDVLLMLVKDTVSRKMSS